MVASAAAAGAALVASVPAAGVGLGVAFALTLGLTLKELTAVAFLAGPLVVLVVFDTTGPPFWAPLAVAGTARPECVRLWSGTALPPLVVEAFLLEGSAVIDSIACEEAGVVSSGC